MLNQWQIIMINTAIFFGHYVIISSALNFQFGNGGIPNMSSNVSVAVGAYTVSALVVRLCMWIGKGAGLVFGADWVYDNPANVRMLTGLFQAKPLLSLGMFLFSLAAAFTLGTATGWLIGLMSGRLRATRLMILLLIISNAVSVIAANNKGIAGGTLGAFIPNFFAWYRGEQMVIIATVILVVGLTCYLIMRAMMNSPFGRLMRALRDNEVTLESAGKNVTNIRRQVMMFGSGIMALSGVLVSYYYSYVQHTMYDRVTYTFWPWLMITLGGLGNNAGSYLGTLLCVAVLKALNVMKQGVGVLLIGTKWIKLIDIFEDLFLGAFLILFMIYRPRGLVPEKNLSIDGVDYVGMVREGPRPGAPGDSSDP
jgi:branched-chain amino acid transport system permease protein